MNNAIINNKISRMCLIHVTHNLWNFWLILPILQFTYLKWLMPPCLYPKPDFTWYMSPDWGEDFFFQNIHGAMWLKNPPSCITIKTAQQFSSALVWFPSRGIRPQIKTSWWAPHPMKCRSIGVRWYLVLYSTKPLQKNKKWSQITSVFRFLMQLLRLRNGRDPFSI